MATSPPRSRMARVWPFGGGAGEPPAAERVRRDKVGAGLLLTCLETGDVMLLLRNSSHNDRTWGLPGGNADEEDGARSAPNRLSWPPAPR